MIQALTPEINQGVTIILDGLKFDWYQWEMDEAVKLVKAGADFDEMLEALRPPFAGEHREQSYNRRADELDLLLLHLARRGRIRRDGMIVYSGRGAEADVG